MDRTHEIPAVFCIWQSQYAGLFRISIVFAAACMLLLVWAGAAGAEVAALSGRTWQRPLQIERSVDYDAELRCDIVEVAQLLQSHLYPAGERKCVLEIIHLGVYMHEYWNYKLDDVKLILQTLVDFNAPSVDLARPSHHLETIREDYAPVYDDFSKKRELIEYKTQRLFDRLLRESASELKDTSIDGVPLVSQVVQ